MRICKETGICILFYSLITLAILVVIASSKYIWRFGEIIAETNLPIKLSCDIDASLFLVQKVRIGIRLTDEASGANIQFADSFVPNDCSGYNILGVYTPKEVTD